MLLSFCLSSLQIPDGFATATAAAVVVVSTAGVDVAVRGLN